MKTEKRKATKEEAPVPPPPPGTLPELPLPAPIKQKSSANRQAVAAANPCEALTRGAIQAAIDQIDKCVKSAKDDETANVNNTWGYATTYSRQYVEAALNGMNVLQSWLRTAGIDKPFVSNATGASNVSGYARQSIVDLHMARFWGTISAIYHGSLKAQDSYELITQAIELLEQLSTQAGRCYMRPYLP